MPDELKPYVAGRAEPASAPPPVQTQEVAKAGQPLPLEDLHIDELLHTVVDTNASDLHICNDSEPVIRIDGQLRRLNYQKFTPNILQRMLYDILTDEQIHRFESTLELDFSYALPRRARFRVNVYRDRGSCAAAFRLISDRIPTVRDLNLPPILEQITEKPRGLVLVTGPTGSGKSTTLAAMIDYINSNRGVHIITIEDPIEFVHKNIKCLVNQREIGVHTTSFKAALRAALREDPDIVLVGEMRDLETISIAIETAETGHLVFGTLHTTTAVSTVDRIIDQFPTDQQEQIRVMLSESLKGVIAQVLCKKKGGGRVAAMEILLGNNAVASLIREGKTFQIPSIMQTSKGAGMITMNDSLLMLVQKGLVEPKEAWMKAVDKNGLLAMFKSNGIPTQFS